MIPKKSLTGDNTERVDTRVLQVIYALPDQRPIPVYVGQQMDVFLAVGDNEKALANDRNPSTRPALAGLDTGAGGPEAKPGAASESVQH